MMMTMVMMMVMVMTMPMAARAVKRTSPTPKNLTTSDTGPDRIRSKVNIENTIQMAQHNRARAAPPPSRRQWCRAPSFWHIFESVKTNNSESRIMSTQEEASRGVPCLELADRPSPSRRPPVVDSIFRNFWCSPNPLTPRAGVLAPL
uniref:Putative secreted protein n=1 Tax=Anopheles darlingi TaxID=43151 RepID=A0A2M4DCT9_ANODA